ncbi:hypothetical protein [Diaphorobacter sp. JS3051]|uniref:hypothetical protein n=1 Tax=Diaphorobacter sp. JS3051 TaxID=2792224 RepID=UPI001E42764A|nr:hypothetical protein [Diaphorobacter sp. JS3051]
MKSLPGHSLFRIFNMKLSSLLAVLSVVAALSLSLPARAHDGHDDAAPVAAGPSLPRFTAVSDDFELVGVLNGKEITLYLDRASDNAPVTDAQIELEIGGKKHTAKKHEDVYEVELAAEPATGVLPITATVMVGSESDLLAGELDRHEVAHNDTTAPAKPWTRYAAWAAGIAAALAALYVIGRRMTTSRSRRAGDAA